MIILYNDKLELIDNIVLIYNYKSITKLEPNYIQTPKYSIDIENLEVISLDGYLLKLKGRVKNIEIL